jgi:hypothetical protein
MAITFGALLGKLHAKSDEQTALYMERLTILLSL